MPENNLADIYGFLAQPSPEEQAVPLRINDMLQTQWKQTEQQRTNAAQMAKFAALGNVLQTAFAPAAWAVGGATTQVAKPDQQGYITAFNNVLQADRDLANIGKQGAQMQLNYQMGEANHARARRERIMDTIVNDQIAQRRAETAHQNKLDEIKARYESRENIERLRASLRGYFSFTDKDGKSLDEKTEEILAMSLARQYAKIQGDYYRGLSDFLPSWEEFIANRSRQEGYIANRSYDRGNSSGWSKGSNGSKDKGSKDKGDNAGQATKHAEGL